jgi:hypothetical protein
MLDVAGRVGRVPLDERAPERADVGHPVKSQAAPVQLVTVVGEQVPAPAGRHQLVRLEPALGLVAADVHVAGADVLVIATGARQRHEHVGFDRSVGLAGGQGDGRVVHRGDLRAQPGGHDLVELRQCPQGRLADARHAAPGRDPQAYGHGHGLFRIEQ